MLLHCLPTSVSSTQLKNLEGYVIWRFLRWPTWRLSWLSERNDFSNSKSPCGSNAFHQVWVLSDRCDSSCGFKIFKMATQAAILDSQTEQFKQFWISVSLRCFLSSFGSIQLMVWEKTSFEDFQDGHHDHLGYQNGTILALLNMCVAPIPPIKFLLNMTGFGRRCRLENFKMAAMAAILDIGKEQF